MIDEAEAVVLLGSIRKAIDSAIDERTRDLQRENVSLRKAIEDLELRIKAIPCGPVGPQGERGESVKGDRGERGQDAPPVDLVKLAADVASLIPVPRDGRDGEKGADGLRGERGEKGADGLRGERGEKGADGLRGERGEKGADGLRGERGEAGPAGPKGDVGERGIDGESIRGEIGPAGPRGEKGLDGKDGRDGREGKDGRDGKDGEPGRDALDIDILADIDESKTYPRGTFAQRAGGIARFTGVEWRQIIAAPAEPRSVIDHETEQSTEDPRRFTFRTVFSDGTVKAKEAHIPVMLFKSVFKSGQAYLKGDVVSKDGSMWVCLVDSTKATPGDSQDWQLSVKRGKDGKGEKGEKGDPGQNGRDLRYQ